MSNGNNLLPLIIFTPIICGVISFFIGKISAKFRENFACLVTFFTLIISMKILGEDYIFEIPYVFSMGIGFQSGSIQGVFVVLASFVWFVTSIFSKEYFKEYKNRNRYYFFMLTTLGATLGVFLSKDLYTTFIFFEIMSFTSYVLVMHDETEKARRAGNTYLTVAVIGGLVMLMGLFLMYNKLGTLDFFEMHNIVKEMSDAERKNLYPIAMLILFGFGGKAGLFPVHIWLPEAHPVAPAPASAILSCVLTKTGIFGMIVISCQIFTYDYTWGYIVLWLGTITMFLGAFLAMFSADLKKILACSSLSQIGFITVGIGMQGVLGSHNAIASTGTILHVINHGVLKLILFMCAGVIYINTHKLNLNDIRGFGKNKPILKFVFIMASLGITGVPYWNGYISKTLLHESIVEQIVILRDIGNSSTWYSFIEFIFLLSGGFTIAYILKIYVAIFCEKPKKGVVFEKIKYMTPLSSIVLIVCAILPMFIGLFPHTYGANIAEISYEFMHSHTPDHHVEYMAWINLKGAVASFIMGIFTYVTFVRQFLMDDKDYIEIIPKGWSLEEKIYRPILLVYLPYIGGFVARFMSTFTDGIVAILRITIFNDDNGRIIPKEDQYFTTYNDFGIEKNKYKQGFEQNLLFMGLGVAAALLYILI